MMISIWVQDARAIIMDHEIHPIQLCTISSTSRTPTKYFSTAYLSEECTFVMAYSTHLEFVAFELIWWEWRDIRFCRNQIVSCSNQFHRKCSAFCSGSMSNRYGPGSFYWNYDLYNVSTLSEHLKTHWDDHYLFDSVENVLLFESPPYHFSNNRMWILNKDK